MNYTEKLNALKASASAELERLIRKYGVENKCETDESTYSVFIGTDSPDFVVIDRVFCGRDYPLELVLDPTEHANEVDFDKELRKLQQGGSILKAEQQAVEKLLMNNNPDDGVQGSATLWKLTQAITAHARELTPERARELHEISGNLLNRVKLTA